MVREKKWVEYPDDTQLGRSRDDSGASSPNLFVPGSQGVKGQAKIYDIDEDEADSLAGSPPDYVYVTHENESNPRAKELSEAEKELIALVLTYAIKAAVKLAPHAKKFWTDQALPAIKSTRNKLIARTRRAASLAATDESATLIGSAPADSSQEVIAAVEEYRASMSSTEARERFAAALVARIFSDEQLRVLRDAWIECDNGPMELESAMETLTPRQVGDSIALMLETNPSLLHEETLSGLGIALNAIRLPQLEAPPTTSHGHKNGRES